MNENADGFITSAKTYTEMNADGDGVLNAGDSLYVTGTKKAEDGTVGLGGTYYAYSDDVVVARWTLEDDAIEISRINSVKNDTNDKVVAIMDGRVVIGLFIIEVKGGEEAASNDATISNVEMFGVPVENGKVTVPGSANGAGEQRLTFDLADGAKVTGVYYRESTSGNWNSWGDDYKLTANLGQSKLYVKIESVAADGTSTDSYEFEANLGAACTVTINATNALVKIDGKAVSGNVTFSQGETLILTIVPADGMKISEVKWDSGSAIPGFGGEYRITVPNTATATLNVTVSQ